MAAENHASEATPAALRPSLYRADTPRRLFRSGQNARSFPLDLPASTLTNRRLTRDRRRNYERKHILASVFGSKARTARLENTASPIKTNWSTIAIPAPFWANAQAVSPVTHLDIDLAGATRVGKCRLDLPTQDGIAAERNKWQVGDVARRNNVRPCSG
jgi:hypothetical protein